MCVCVCVCVCVRACVCACVCVDAVTTVQYSNFINCCIYTMKLSRERNLQILCDLQKCSLYSGFI